MNRDDLADLTAFLAVAEARSFTRAAAGLGQSQSALSQTVRRLEARLGVRLLTRTTRSVAPSAAGERLLAVARPALAEIAAGLGEVSALRPVPAGLVRLTAGRHAAVTVLWPALSRLSLRYPDITVDLSVDQALTDIVSERFDAGVRLGEQVGKDMIAVRIGPDVRMAVVGSADYFAAHGVPGSPDALTRHRCINIRMPTAGGLYVWEFEKAGRVVNVRVDGPFILNDPQIAVRAAADGLGVAMVMEDLAAEGCAQGRLVRVLEDWCPPFAGYHLYYPDRRHPSPAFAAVVEALRESLAMQSD